MQRFTMGRSLLRFGRVSSLAVAAFAGGCTAGVAHAQFTPGHVFTWGLPSNEQQPALDLGTLVQVAAGYDYLVGIRPDRSLVQWGSEFGDVHTVPAGIGPCVKVSAWWGHTLALTEEGEVVAWGFNNRGECTLPPGLDIAIDVAAGKEFSLAVDSHGTVFGWGYNSNGQASPPSNLGPVFKVFAGARHSAALLVNGTVKCWGSNASGQCAIPSNLGPCSKLALGDRHTVALRNDGTVVCWGDNGYGQCSTPTGLGPCVDIAAGAYYTIAVRADGSLVGWGIDDYLIDSPPQAGGPYLSVAASPYTFAVARADRGAPTRDRCDLDDRSDLVFHQKTSKAVHVWLMDGLTIKGGGDMSMDAASTKWKAEGLGDFNGDGHAEILWRTETGHLVLWFPFGQLVVQAQQVDGAGALPKTWTVVAIGDVNGDRMADIVLRNPLTNTLHAWLFRAHHRIDTATLGTMTGLTFTASGDFDGDGTMDLAFRTSNGAVHLWLLTDAVPTGGLVTNASPISSAWKVEAVGDLDGDGNDDLVWRNSQDGQVNGWLMDGFARKAGGPIGAIALDWTLETSADLNGDGKGDLVWRNAATTQVNGWLMNGLTKESGGAIASTGPGWTIVNR
jgi:hypothetical protein